MCLVYVNECLFFAKDEWDIEEMNRNLGTKFDLEPETDVSAFLGIQFKHHESGKIELMQPHLIQRIIETVFWATGCNAKATPAGIKPIGTDANGAPCCEKMGLCICRWDDDVPVNEFKAESTGCKTP